MATITELLGVKQDKTLTVKEHSTPYTSVPEKTSEFYRLKKLRYGRGLYRMEGVMSYEYFEVVKPITVTQLEYRNAPSERWQPLMVDDPLHWLGMKELASQCSGRVLVGGLGMGLVLHHLITNRDVTKIIGVEIDPELTEFIHPYLPVDDRIEIVHSNYFGYVIETDQRFNSAIIDLWVLSGQHPEERQRVAGSMGVARALTGKVADKVFIWGIRGEIERGKMSTIAELLEPQVEMQIPAPFGWPGGKRLLSKRIISLIPLHKTYVEPFAGAASVFWAKEPSEVEVLNDIDPDLMRFYRDIHSIEHCNIKRISQNWDTLRHREGDVEACDFLAQVLCSYGEKRKTGRPTSLPVCQNDAPQFHKYLPQYQERLKQTKLHNEDWEKVVRQYDASDTFFYFDPPYHGIKGLYNYQEDQLSRLSQVLPRLKGKWLLSYNDHPDVGVAFKNYNLQKVSFNYTLGKVKPELNTELLIANYPIKLEMKQDDNIEWDAWFTDKMSITHLALLEDHLLDYSQRSADDACKNCMLWHCEKLKGYSIYEAPKFFDGDHESTYQKAGELAQAIQDSLGNLAQSEALDYAKKVRDLRYELIGYGVYDFTVAQGQDRQIEELERYIKEAEMANSMVTKSELAVIEARLKPFRDEIKLLDTPEKWAGYGAKVIKLWKEWDLPQAATPPEYYVLSMQWQVAPSRLTARRLKEALEEDLGVPVFPGIASQLLDKYAYFEMKQEGAEMANPKERIPLTKMQEEAITDLRENYKAIVYREGESAHLVFGSKGVKRVWVDMEIDGSIVGAWLAPPPKFELSQENAEKSYMRYNEGERIWKLGQKMHKEGKELDAPAGDIKYTLFDLSPIDQATLYVGIYYNAGKTDLLQAYNELVDDLQKLGGYAQESPKTIQQLLQEQDVVEQAQKARPKDIIFWKTTIEKHYQPKEAFYPDSFRTKKVDGARVTLGCLKKHKWYPEKLECVPTQTLHRTIVPRTEKYIKEAEEWAAIGVPTQHRETEVGIEPRDLIEVV